jgi:hypothetical protein
MDNIDFFVFLLVPDIRTRKGENSDTPQIERHYSISNLITAFLVQLLSLLSSCCQGALGTVALPHLLKMPASPRQAVENWAKKTNIHLLRNRLSDGLNGTEAGWKQPMLTSLWLDSPQYLNVNIHHNTMFFIILCCLLPGNKMFYSIQYIYCT